MKTTITNILKSQWLWTILAFIIFMLLTIIVADISAADATLGAVIVPGIAGGKHIAGEPLTLTNTEEASPGLLRNEIDQRIVKIRPMATPIDQISRIAGARRAGAMEVQFYAVDTPKIETVTTKPYTIPTGKPSATIPVRTLAVENGEIFAPSETAILPDVILENGEALVVYVTAITPEKSIQVLSVNHKNASGINDLPEIPEGVKVVRMGRAAGELDVMTSQFQALPKSDTNFCQIFKTQVEQSTYQKIANKVIGWNFSDQEEAAIIDMRQGMEKNFLFGKRARLLDPEKATPIWLTGGIWDQAGKQFEYTVGNFNNDSLVRMCRKAFTGMGSSSKKILVGGSALIEELTKLEHTKVIGAAETMTRWGLDFTEIVTKFGKLYVMISETFDQCGRASDGMIIDPEYITKYCHVPFSTKLLDLRSAGLRNTDAIVITEASCLVLRYPDAHMRIIGRSVAQLADQQDQK